MLSILFDFGAPHPLLDRIVGAIPPKNKAPAIVKNVNFGIDIESLSAVSYRYEGSLTAPPCSEQVKWLVLRAPATISQSQVNMIIAKQGMMSNNRPTQARNGRRTFGSVLSGDYIKTEGAGVVRKHKWDYFNKDALDNEWAVLSDTCAIGGRKSPINIASADNIEVGPLVTDYSNSMLRLTNNGLH